MRVEREDPGVGSAREEHVDEDALLLLEGAREGDVRVQRLEDGLDDLLCAQALDVGCTHALLDAPLLVPNGITHENRLCE